MLPRSSMVLVVTACLLATWSFSTTAFGYDLSLDRLAVRVETSQRLAHTRMTLVIKNSGGQWEEALVDLDLPLNAVVTRLSMDVGIGDSRPRMQGRVFDRERAAEVYQDIVDSARDPAILEDVGDGRYRLRVFPIPGHDKKTVIIEYEHLLPQRRTVATYLFEPPELAQGSTRIPRFTLSIDGNVEQRGPWPSQQPVRVTLHRTALRESSVHYTRYRGKTYFRVDIVPDVETEQDPIESVVLALDSSRTSQHSYEEALEQSRIIIEDFGPQAQVRIVRGDHEVERCADLACATSVRPAGVSNVHALLRSAIEVAQSLPGPVAIVLVGDGHLPADADEETLVDLLEKLPASMTVHALAIGTYQARFLRRLAHAGRGYLAFDAKGLLQRVFEPTVSEVSVRANSADVLVNEQLSRSNGAGEPISVYGRLETPSARLQVRARMGLKEYRHDVMLRPSRRLARNRSVLRGWVRTATEEQAHELSNIKVLTQSQAFLVLETVAEYQQFEEPQRPRMQHRRARKVAPPSVKLGRVSIGGSLEPSILRRRIRQVRSKIGHCYNRILRRTRDTEGTMIAAWTIDLDGKSVDVSVNGDINSEQLRSCIARVHQEIHFPVAQNGGYIKVRYPYHFIPPAEHNTKLSIADEGQELAQLLERGDVEGATVLFALIKRELAPQPSKALLPYLTSANARARFGTSYRSAALNSIDSGSATDEVWLGVANSFATEAPRRLALVLGARKPRAALASKVLHSLIQSRHRTAALELSQAWKEGTMTLAELYEVFASDPVVQNALPRAWMSLIVAIVDEGGAGQAMEYLIETAHSLDQDSDAVDRVLSVCEQASAPCERWLSSELRDPRMLERLHTLYDGEVAQLTTSRQSSEDVERLGNLLELLRQYKEATRVRSELAEY